MRKLTKIWSRARRGQSGFTLVELLVVVSIIVALAAVTVVSVSKFAGKGDEGAKAAELDAVQVAMDTMMADLGIEAVTSNGSGVAATQAFATLPTEGPLSGYLRDAVTYYYCWDATGMVTQLAAAGTCP